ncbi:hypothetical protein HORIV_07820 [Vreelandella olivaria]|uniref:Uncharacterized protein n=1 Tax=Vreelandella olivaria TaxID=390919 RepID=A0ABM7GD53_9GAMM|nr:hypothetical protein HORIV_07820 [Halomonas olivaria]
MGNSEQGDTNRRIARSNQVPRLAAKNSTTIASATAELTNPLAKLTATERPSPGWANSICQGVKLMLYPPNAGK